MNEKYLKTLWAVNEFSNKQARMISYGFGIYRMFACIECWFPPIIIFAEPEILCRKGKLNRNRSIFIYWTSLSITQVLRIGLLKKEWDYTKNWLYKASVEFRVCPGWAHFTPEECEHCPPLNIWDFMFSMVKQCNSPPSPSELQKYLPKKNTRIQHCTKLFILMWNGK